MAELHQRRLSMQWRPDHASKTCSGCDKKFRALTRRRHHCRLCGSLMCGKCTSKRFVLDHKSLRICSSCSDDEPVQQETPKEAIGVNATILEVPRQIVQEEEASIDVDDEPVKIAYVAMGSSSVLIAMGLLLLTPLAAYTPTVVIDVYPILISLAICLSSYSIYRLSTTAPVAATVEAVVEQEPSQEEEPVSLSTNVETAIEAIKVGFQLGIEALSAEDGWKYHSKRSGVDISLKREMGEEHMLTYVRGEKVVNVSIPDLIETMKNHLVEYDDKVDAADVHQDFEAEKLQAAVPEFEVVEDFNCTVMQYRRIFPTAARDACVALCSATLKGTTTKVIVARSIPRDDVPPVKNIVRCDMRCYLIHLEKISETTTRMRMVCMLDPKGYIPTFVVAAVAPELPEALDKLSNCAIKYAKAD